MDGLARALGAALRAAGADLVGCADLSQVPGAELPRGVSVAVAIAPEVVAGLSDGPTPAYRDAYHALNARLDGIVTVGARLLQARGYAARPQTTTSVVESAGYRTPLPHKTVATRAGLGWIGRCALLVTEEYGSALRLSSVVTDAPLPCAAPIGRSRCGGCRACQRACPGGAVMGAAWDVHTGREALVDVECCRETARGRAEACIGQALTLCGKCIEVCPYTRRYLAAARR
ncbi:MAG: epoxyqueuosine reductase [Clostridiales bacterium]|nr:epoxyqueuosine reductase [Clostridiales bacterium]